MGISSVDELSTIFVDSFLEVISTSTGINLDVISSESDTEFSNMTAVICLSGSKPGMLFISADADTAKALCSYMIGVSKDSVTQEDCIDAMCEFANMTAGNAKLRLGNSEFLFTLSSPFIIEGKEMFMTAKKKVHVISTSFGSNELNIKMKLMY